MSRNSCKKIFFTSDWHIGHANCLKFDNRPFADIEEMHSVLIKRFNSTVPENSVTYFLGDIGLCSKERTKEVIEKLNGTKVLVRGNHDGKMFAMYDIGFDVVVEKAQITLGQEIITMSHCPLLGIPREDLTGMRGAKEGDNWHGESRHGQSYAFEDFGQFHLHGHIHSGPETSNKSKIMGRQYDVGVVANDYRPVSLSQIEKFIFETKKREKMNGKN